MHNSEKVTQYSYQKLKCAADVQNRLDTSRDHCNGRPAKLYQVCTDVQTWRENHDIKLLARAQTDGALMQLGFKVFAR